MSVRADRYDRWKPKQYLHWLTITELGKFVKRDVTSIRRLEKKGRIPKGKRVKHGKINVRLYSPELALEIKAIIERGWSGRSGV